LLFVAAVMVVRAGVAAGGELKPGDVLSRDNWELAADLLPPEILRHYKNGEYENPIMRWEKGRQHWSRAFMAHTRANAKSLTVDEQGAVVDKRTGKRPPYIYGFPFPDVSRDDPRAGIKILWNQFFGWWNNGNFHNFVEIHWVSPKGVERSATQDVFYLYYQGQPRAFIPPQNPDDLLTQSLSKSVAPADLNGTAALTWRSRDPRKRDAVWAYVPALRRVRAVSPANRSDGFLGSDMSQDDGPFFDGKPEDFTWKLVGEQDILRLADPYSLRRQCIRQPLSSGGYRGLFQHVNMVGFQDPKWRGSPWAPLSFALVRRPAWIVEGVPKDRYYLFGKVQLYIDRETYQGAYNRKFGWDGELLNTYTVFANLNLDTNGNDDYYGNGCVVYQGAENIRANRATVVTAPLEHGDPPNDRRIHMKPQFFSSQSLMRFGK